MNLEPRFCKQSYTLVILCFWLARFLEFCHGNAWNYRRQKHCQVSVALVIYACLFHGLSEGWGRMAPIEGLCLKLPNIEGKGSGPVTYLNAGRLGGGEHSNFTRCLQLIKSVDQPSCFQHYIDLPAAKARYCQIPYCFQWEIVIEQHVRTCQRQD